MFVVRAAACTGRFRPGCVDRAGGHGLPHGGVRESRLRLRDGQVADAVQEARLVHGNPWLVDEGRARRRAVDDLRVDVPDRVLVHCGIAVLLVVQVHEAGDEDDAVFRVSVEGDAGVVEEAVGTGADDRVGGRREQGERARARNLLWVTRQQGAPPGDAAVEGLEHAEPRVARLRGVRCREGNVDRAIVVGAREKVTRVSRGHGDRGLVLPLEERVAAGPLDAGHHVDALAGDLSAQLDRDCGGKQDGHDETAAQHWDDGQGPARKSGHLDLLRVEAAQPECPAVFAATPSYQERDSVPGKGLPRHGRRAPCVTSRRCRRCARRSA